MGPGMTRMLTTMGIRISLGAFGDARAAVLTAHQQSAWLRARPHRLRGAAPPPPRLSGRDARHPAAPVPVHRLNHLHQRRPDHRPTRPPHLFTGPALRRSPTPPSRGGVAARCIWTTP